MVIPPGAAYLFVGPHDSLYEDNSDPNGDYALRITLLACVADIAPAGSPDGVVDVNDLLAVISASGPCGNPNNCPADVAPPCGDDLVNIDDLLAVISNWGPCPAPPASCPANIVVVGSSATNVDIDDLLAVISAWGPCP